MSIKEKAAEIIKLQVKAYMGHTSIPASIEADDLTQEAQLRMLKYIRHFSPRKGRLNTFLNYHTVGAIKDHLRRVDGYHRGTKNMALVSGDVPERFEAEDFDEEQEGFKKALGEVIGQLSERHRVIIFQYFWEERTCREIGDSLGICEGRVVQLKKKALEKLSGALRKNGIVSMSQLAK